MLPDFEWGWAGTEQEIYCLHKVGDKTGRMLCGNPVGFIPIHQPADPKNKCRDCLQAMYGPTPAVPKMAVCPACSQGVWVEDGRIGGHEEPSGGRCPGVNLRVGRKR